HDDRAAERGGSQDLPARDEGHVEALTHGERPPEGMLLLGETPQAVLDDDDGAVDDESKVDGTKAHEIAARSGLNHADRREEHGKRDGERGDERRPEIAEHAEENDHDQ